MDNNPESEGLIPEQNEEQASADVNQQVLPNNQQPSVDDIALFVKQLSLTYSKFALYPPDHPVTQNQIKTTWDELLPVFEKYGNVDISFAEGTLVFFGMPVEQKNLTVKKFAQHFESINIKSIELFKELTFDVFTRFITVFGQDSKIILEQGGADSLLKQHEISNITFHAAVYQVVREDQKVVDEEAEKNERLDEVKGITPASPDEEKAQKILVEYMESNGSLNAIQKLLESINMNPETIKRVIRDIKRIMEETGLEADELMEYLEHQIEKERESEEDEEKGKKIKKKRRKKVSKKFRPLADRIRDKLKTDFKDITGKDKLIDYLDNVYSREIARVVESKTAELQEQIEKDKKTFFRIGEALEETDVGVIVLDDYKKICFMEHTEVLPIQLVLGEELPPELMPLIKTSREERQWKVEQTRVGQIRFILFKV